jgi:outer membrane receptor for monomeric catechols
MSYFHPNDCQTENLECPNNDKNFICRKCEVDNLPFNQLNETDFQNTITSLTADEIEHDNINLRNFIISYYSNEK